jgi:hypothetical protein
MVSHGPTCPSLPPHFLVEGGASSGGHQDYGHRCMERDPEHMFSSQMRARSVNTCVQLVTTQKGRMMNAEYVNKMRSLADEMVVVERILEEDELVEYILTDLSHEYDPIVSAVIAKTGTMSVSELYAQLLAFETRLTLMGAQEGGGSSMNAVNRGRGRGSHGGFGRGGYGRGNGGRESSPNEGNHGGRFSGRRGGYNSSSDKRPLCQVCKKKGHTIDRCWHRFDEDYVLEERMTAAATGSGHDNSWYTNSGAIDHVTGDLEKLVIREKYAGNDQIHTASGSSMKISHIVHSTIHTPCCQLQLNNILHVPQALKNLVSIHRLASDLNFTHVSFVSRI